MTDASASNPMNEAAPPADHSVTTTGGDTGAPASDAKAPMSDAPKIVDAPEQVDAPMTCVKYCSCMAKWCADKIFATGCLVECTRQTNWISLPSEHVQSRRAAAQQQSLHPRVR